MAKKAKSKFMIWLEFCPFAVLYGLIRILPLKVAYGLAIGLSKLFYLFEGRHTNRIRQHLKHAGIAESATEIERLTRRCLRSFGMLLVEIVKLDQCYSPDKVTVTGNREAIEKIWSPDGQNINVIIVTAHYGNWEVAGMNWTVKSGNELFSIMRDFDNPLIGELILRHRRSERHHLVSQQGGIRQLIKALRSGSSVAILPDQHAGGQSGVETVFFGHPCKTHMSPAQLSLKTGVPIVVYLTRRKPGYNFEFEGVFGDLIEYSPTGDTDHDVRTLTQMYTDGLENLIRQEPEQWLWSHRRWLDINRKKSSKGGC